MLFRSAYIAADAKVKRAVNDIILSKSFDNGMICASEQAAIVDAALPVSPDVAIILLCEYVVSSFSLGDLAIGSNFDNADDYH